MTIESHNAYTICIRPVMPPKAEAKITVPISEAYLAILMAEDAKLIRERHGKSQSYAKPTNETVTEKQARYRADQAECTRETRQAILDALTRSATASDVVTRIKRDEHMIRRQLVIMASLGLVEGHKCKNV